MRIAFLGLVAVVSPMVVTAVAAAEDSLEAVCAAARTKWQAQREGAVTGHFSLRLFRYSAGGYARTLSAPEFKKLVAGANATNIGAVLQEIRQGFMSGHKDPNWQPLWDVPVEVYGEGVKFRNEWRGQMKMVHVFDGHDWVDHVGHQASIKAGRTNMDAFTLQNLCCLPNDYILREFHSDRAQRLPDGYIAVAAGRFQLEFDPATGFVRRRTYTTGPEQAAPLEEIRQTDPQRLEGGFLFPRMKMVVRYQGGQVRFFEVLLIEKAELNREIPAEAFAVSSPPGTVVADFRDKTESGHTPTRELREEVADVREFANTHDLKSLEFPLAQPTGRSRWYYALFTVPLLGLAAWYTLRWRRRAGAA